MVIGVFETTHFDFQVCGDSIYHCVKLMKKAWKVHCKETGADPNYLSDNSDETWRWEMTFFEAKRGTVLRDMDGDNPLVGEPSSPNEYAVNI